MNAKTASFPVLPLRDIVVFPHMVVPLFVGREKSVTALEHAIEENKQILLVTQKSATVDDPKMDDLYKIGTLGNVLQLLKLPDGTVKVLVEGMQRMKIESYSGGVDFFRASCTPMENKKGQIKKIRAMTRLVLEQFESYIHLDRRLSEEIMKSITQIEDVSSLSDTIAQHVGMKVEDKQVLLETTVVMKRLEALLAFMEAEIDVLQVERKIRGRVKRQMEKSQREYYLNEQMKAIQRELGEGDESRDEFGDMEEKIRKTCLSTEAREKAQSEMRKLRHMSPISAEATVVRNYLDWLLSIPWNKRSKMSIDLKKSYQKLDEDHYGLKEVKEHIIEHLAVQARAGKKAKSLIICLVGPPGVGKTSLGKSIAEATGRNFVRMSLGGMRDESEIRGHRRTYIGSMPGKIIQGMKKSKSSNPLFLLDEIDKLSFDWRGDPSSALLEVLDPEQNSNFNDHYLEVDYDISDVMFVTTANSMNISAPLLDRLEIIRIPGYTEEEKVEIARRHLLPKILMGSGLKEEEWAIEDRALEDLIRHYTREAGVRSLERQLTRLARKAVKKIMTEGLTSVVVDVGSLQDFLGPIKYRFGEIEEENNVGVVTGLAWMETGGDLLTIEAVTVPGKGRVTKTGTLGDVMQESIQAAENYVKSRAADFGIERELLEKYNIHIHVPEGATPKDGPSAGVAMAVAIISALTGIPVRKEIAMTGEITLRGRVLAIGGLKEKLLAAQRGGTKTVLIPIDNKKDLPEIPETVTKNLEIIPVRTVDEVLTHALTRALIPVKWDDGGRGEVAKKSIKSRDISEKELERRKGVTRH